MAEQIICDECKKTIREEGEWCLEDEITYTHKKYHFGEGMLFPIKNKKKIFCSNKCFEKWYEKNEKKT